MGIILAILAVIIINILFGTVCLSTLLIGLPCPACGITRATILMLTGHFRESFHMHPLLILVILGIIAYPITKKRLNNYGFFVKFYVIICVVIFVVFYIYRMRIYYPNVEPMVYRQDNYIHNIITLLHKYKMYK